MVLTECLNMNLLVIDQESKMPSARRKMAPFELLNY
uniref:Uncharacterized protein n=1 Tax=Arundo donax TaxID=35708 RepID=A0A0A9FFT7_ARUDO